MKNFKTIFKFELDSYLKNKAYVISTVLIFVLVVGIMFAPRVMDAFKGDDSKVESDEGSAKDKVSNTIAICDGDGIVTKEIIDEFFTGYNIEFCDSAEQVKDLVKSEKAKTGCAIKSISAYEYYVYNKSMFSDDKYMYDEFMRYIMRVDYCTKNNLDMNEFMNVNYMDIDATENILGKDGSSNYWYCYVLIMVIYMMMIFYGTTIATGVTNEKSNRSIEILVTSTSSISLLFGKVMAGVVSAFVQMGVIFAGALGAYAFNKSYWPATIQNFLDIPTNVLVTFAIFGVGGFIIYMFMYGALGALVSKVEDLNKSVGSAQMIVMIVFMITIIQLNNVDSTIMKVLSFLPISSYSAMFVRCAMGSVEMWEIVVSAIILFASAAFVGVIGGKIFRASTLRYGNPIKLSNALKLIKSDK